MSKYIDFWIDLGKELDLHNFNKNVRKNIKKAKRNLEYVESKELRLFYKHLDI